MVQLNNPDAQIKVRKFNYDYDVFIPKRLCHGQRPPLIYSFCSTEYIEQLV